MHKLITAASIGLAAGALVANPVGHMITGKNIKNGTVSSADIKNHSLRVQDFRSGLLDTPSVPPATSASPGPVKVTKHTWTVHFVSDGTSTSYTATSTQKIPADTEVSGLTSQVTTAQPSPCNGFSGFPTFSVSGGSTVASPTWNGTPAQGSVTPPSDTARTLSFTTSCLSGGFPPSPQALPDFDATVTFLTTELTPSTTDAWQ